ncbi:hypothetical protein VTI28DRAFT_3288 [Corynascus sepedonium]
MPLPVHDKPLLIKPNFHVFSKNMHHRPGKHLLAAQPFINCCHPSMNPGHTHDHSGQQMPRNQGKSVPNSGGTHGAVRTMAARRSILYKCVAPAAHSEVCYAVGLDSPPMVSLCRVRSGRFPEFGMSAFLIRTKQLIPPEGRIFKVTETPRCAYRTDMI